MFIGAIKQRGYTVDATPFTCTDHVTGASSLTCRGRTYPVFISPYSPVCNVTAKLVTVSTIEELRDVSCKGMILLMKGGLCAEKLMPKNFPFYNPDNHKEIYSLLEKKQPAAIITATMKSPGLAGGLYQFPLIEDGDFDIPSVYCTDVTGEEIATGSSEAFTLVIDAKRISSTACNVIARKNPGADKKIVICAHIDTKENTPGAIDNASGVTVLLLLAEMLEDYGGAAGIEIAAINGEDNYCVGGELDYLNRYGNEIERIAAAVNIDGAGYLRGRTAYSLYGYSEEQARAIRSVLDGYASLTEGDQWYQGDHTMFVMRGRPVIAFTSENAAELVDMIVHTTGDTPDLVDHKKLVDLACIVKDLITKGILENSCAGEE